MTLWWIKRPQGLETKDLDEKWIELLVFKTLQGQSWFHTNSSLIRPLPVFNTAFLAILIMIVSRRLPKCELKAIFVRLLLSGSLELIFLSGSLVFLDDWTPPVFPFTINLSLVSFSLFSFSLASAHHSLPPHVCVSMSLLLFLIYTLSTPSFTLVPFLPFLHLSPRSPCPINGPCKSHQSTGVRGRW